MKIHTNTKHKKRDITIYVVLRFFVIVTLIAQLIRGNYENYLHLEFVSEK